MNIHEASLNGNIKALLQLLAEGININSPDENGFTPLHVATKKGHKEISLALIEKGADVNATN
jgi:ankyrin repeat protein